MFLRENEVGRRVGPWLDRGQIVLDLGAGTGHISRWLRDRAGVRPTVADVIAYANRDRSLPFIEVHDPFSVPVEDGSFDAVMLLFVLHHVAAYEDQDRVLDEAIRIARTRVIVLEDTPRTRLDLAFNRGWDWLLNLRHVGRSLNEFTEGIWVIPRGYSGCDRIGCRVNHGDSAS